MKFLSLFFAAILSACAGTEAAGPKPTPCVTTDMWDISDSCRAVPVGMAAADAEGVAVTVSLPEQDQLAEDLPWETLKANYTKMKEVLLRRAMENIRICAMRQYLGASIAEKDVQIAYRFDTTHARMLLIAA